MGQLIGKEDSLVDKTFEENIDLSKIALFFMTPQTVARNLLVCTSFFLITSTLWFLPSLLWKKSLIQSISKDDSQEFLSTEVIDTSEERIGGIVSALANTGLADIYNRVLCPTCIVQIIFINTMLVRI